MKPDSSRQASFALRMAELEHPIAIFGTATVMGNGPAGLNTLCGETLRRAGKSTGTLFSKGTENVGEVKMYLTRTEVWSWTRVCQKVVSLKLGERWSRVFRTVSAATL